MDESTAVTSVDIEGLSPEAIELHKQEKLTLEIAQLGKAGENRDVYQKWAGMAFSATRKAIDSKKIPPSHGTEFMTRMRDEAFAKAGKPIPVENWPTRSTVSTPVQEISK